MDRRQLLAGLGASALMAQETSSPNTGSSYLEWKVWRLHTTPEEQRKRVSDYLEYGLMPALARSDARLAGAFSVVIGPNSPAIYTLTVYPSLARMQETVSKLASDKEHTAALEELGSGSGLPFVRVDSSLLRSFFVLPQPRIEAASAPRIFELRTYESHTFLTLTRKVGMFNDGEAAIFTRLQFRPVFFGETLVGANQPNLMYMLSYDNLAARDALWKSFGSDPEWQKLSKTKGLTDPEIVANIDNLILSPLQFSAIR